MRKSVEIYEFENEAGAIRYDVYLNTWNEEDTPNEKYFCDELLLDVEEERAEKMAKRIAAQNNCEIVRTP